MRYYIDTCIWLNLFQRERGPRPERPYWEIAGAFAERVLRSENDRIVYSGAVLRELETTTGEAAGERKAFLGRMREFIRVDATHEDRADARKLESKYGFTVSFGDCIHLVLARRMEAVLVTRDRGLLAIARAEGVSAVRPEEVIDG